jgi:MFS family permease
MDPIVLPLIGVVKTWQMVFLLLGAPGLLLAALALTIREPVRRSATGKRVETVMSISEVLAQFRRHKWAYLGIALGFSLMILVGNGTSAWTPAFLSRKFGWDTARVGSDYGPIVLCCGIVGALAGGFVAGQLRKRGIRRANLLTALGGFIALVPLTISFPLVPSPQLALILIGAMNFFAAFNFGGGLAALQEITPNGMRAVTSSIYSLSVNLIGAGVGPLAVALFTDQFFGDPAKLPEALALTAGIMSPLALLMLWLGLANYRRALDDVQTHSAR